jgi:hypothetical protein
MLETKNSQKRVCARAGCRDKGGYVSDCEGGQLVHGPTTLSQSIVWPADRAFHGTIYATGFESPTFTASLPLMGQDNWVGVAGPPGPNLSPNAAIISRDLVFSGQQSVLVAGGIMVSDKIVSSATAGYYDAIGSYQRVVNFDVGANRIPIVRVEAAVRLDGPLSPSANNFFAAAVQAIGLCDPILPGCHFPGVGALAISSDGKVYGWSGNNLVPGCPNPPCVPPASFLISAPISLGAWHILAVDVNFQTRTFSFSVDGTPLPGGPFPSMRR